MTEYACDTITDLDMLEEMRLNAAAAENYEYAARVRDRIKKLRARPITMPEVELKPASEWDASRGFIRITEPSAHGLWNDDVRSYRTGMEAARERYDEQIREFQRDLERIIEEEVTALNMGDALMLAKHHGIQLMDHRTGVQEFLIDHTLLVQVSYAQWPPQVLRRSKGEL